MAAIKLIPMMFHKMQIFQRQAMCSLRKPPYLYQMHRINANYSQSASQTAEVEEIKKLLKRKFPLAKKIIVDDLSGGCGEMYKVDVETVEFKGIGILEQHKLVNEALSEKIRNMHGITINTNIPSANN